jgi:hypothetical protein
MKIELNEKEVGQIVESLLILQSVMYEDVLSIPSQYSFIFNEYPESKSFDDSGEFTVQEEKSMMDKVDSFLSQNKLIIRKLLKNG